MYKRVITLHNIVAKILENKFSMFISSKNNNVLLWKTCLLIIIFFQCIKRSLNLKEISLNNHIIYLKKYINYRKYIY